MGAVGVYEIDAGIARALGARVFRDRPRDGVSATRVGDETPQAELGVRIPGVQGHQRMDGHVPVYMSSPRAAIVTANPPHVTIRRNSSIGREQFQSNVGFWRSEGGRVYARAEDVQVRYDIVAVLKTRRESDAALMWFARLFAPGTCRLSVKDTDGVTRIYHARTSDPLDLAEELQGPEQRTFAAMVTVEVMGEFDYDDGVPYITTSGDPAAVEIS